MLTELGADEEAVAGFRNAILNGELTEAQAIAIASDVDAFELYVKATAGRLGANPTIADMINAAGYVGGFDLSGDISPYYDKGYSETVESDVLVPDSETGVYDAGTGTVILNKKAEPIKKLSYKLAQELLSDVLSTNNYSYDSLLKKPPLAVSGMAMLNDSDIQKYKSNKSQFSSDMVQKVREQNNPNNTETKTYLFCPDMNADVLITRDTFKHSAARVDDLYYSVCFNISSVVENSIVVNELKPRENTNGSFVLLGVLENNDDIVIVRTVIDKKTWKTEDYKIVKAINRQAIKKEDVVGIKSTQDYTVEGGSQTSSIISISNLLNTVKEKRVINSVLQEDVLYNLGVKRMLKTVIFIKLQWILPKQKTEEPFCML